MNAFIWLADIVIWSLLLFRLALASWDDLSIISVHRHVVSFHHVVSPRSAEQRDYFCYLRFIVTKLYTDVLIWFAFISSLSLSFFFIIFSLCHGALSRGTISGHTHTKNGKKQTNMNARAVTTCNFNQCWGKWPPSPPRLPPPPLSPPDEIKGHQETVLNRSRY